MYLKKFEYYILDSSVAGTLLLMALAIRIEAVNAGFDQFSSNIIFISVFIISTGLYISMQIALYEIIIYLPAPPNPAFILTALIVSLVSFNNWKTAISFLMPNPNV